MLEKEIENAILEYLALIGIYAWKNQTTGVYDTKRKIFRKSWNKYHINGVADILGILPTGMLLAIEVKTKKTYPSQNQKDFLKNISDNKGIAFIARSIDDVKRVLDAILKQS